jgi:Cytidylate kinase-like family
MRNGNSNRKYPTETDMNQCLSYLLTQVQELTRHPFHLHGPGPAVTISYQTGAGEHEIASRLAEILQAAEPVGAPPWTVFDRQLIERVLREHQFPESMARFLPEDRRSIVEEEIGDILGLHPPAWVIVPQIAETVLRLANAGHVILVGRGAVFITARMTNAFHVRIVAPLRDRIERVQKEERLSAKAAAKFITKKDRGHSRYAKAYYHGRMDDSLLYHLVLNTGRISCTAAAKLIAQEALECFQSQAH